MNDVWEIEQFHQTERAKALYDIRAQPAHITYLAGRRFEICDEAQSSTSGHDLRQRQRPMDPRLAYVMDCAIEEDVGQ